MILGDKENLISSISNSVSGIIDEFNGLKSMSINDFNSDRTTLVSIDIINGFIKCGALADNSISGIIKPVKELMQKATNNNMHIVNFIDWHKENATEFSSFPVHCVEKSEEAKLVDELTEFKNYEKYFEIKKNSTNGFLESKFQEGLLVHSNRNTFIVVGNCTDICVLQFCLSLKSYFNKENKPYRVIIPINCVDTFNSNGHNKDFYNLASLKIMNNMGIEIVKEIV